MTKKHNVLSPLPVLTVFLFDVSVHYYFQFMRFIRTVSVTLLSQNKMVLNVEKLSTMTTSI